MTDTIEKLLILQNRDRQLVRAREELSQIEPQRAELLAKAASAHSGLEKAKTRAMQIEASRKAFDVEIEQKKGLITKYANQQLQTRKNEEYRALANEIETCKKEIFHIEDQQISLMEQAEVAQKEIVAATAAAAAAKKVAEEEIAQFNVREQGLRKQLAELESDRGDLAAAVEETARNRYERLARTKGENVVVGVERGVCGGCHMRLPAQLLVSSRVGNDLVTCSNCGRVLYYRPGMDMTMAD